MSWIAKQWVSSQVKSITGQTEEREGGVDWTVRTLLIFHGKYLSCIIFSFEHPRSQDLLTTYEISLSKKNLFTPFNRSLGVVVA
jgi:hypothetical protein